MPERYRAIFQNAAFGLLVLDRDGKIVDFNASASQFLGPARSAILNRPLTDFLDAQGAASFRERVRELWTSGHVALEAALPQPQGQLRSVSLDMCTVPWTPEGEGILVNLRDRTPIEILEERVLLQGQCLEAGRAAGRRQYLVDPEGRARVFAEHAFREKEGPGGSAEPGLTILASEALRPHLKQAWSGIAASLAPEWYPCDSSEPEPHGGSGGQLITPHVLLAIELLPLFGPHGAVLQVLAILEDRTRACLEAERARREDQRAALAAFSGAMHREINTCLGVILAQASALKLDSPRGHLAPPAVGAILDAGQRMAGLLRKAKETSRKSASAEQVDLVELCQEACRVLMSLWEGRLSIRLRLASEAPKVRGHPLLLRSMLIMLGQVGESFLSGRGDLLFTVAPLEEPGLGTAGSVAVSLEVIGSIDPQPRVGRVEGLFAEPGPAPGEPLNLLFVRSVARQHGGHYEVLHSEPTRAVFRVSLPIEDQRPHLTGPLPAEEVFEDQEMLSEIAKASLPEPQPLPQSPGSSSARLAATERAAQPATRHLLLADDEESFRDFAREILGQAGYEVSVAADGQEALEIFEEQPDRYDLVILDAYMPRLGGLETALRIHVFRQELPILFVSGFARGPSLEAMITGCPGRTSVILKPISAEELLASVSCALRE